MDQETLVCKGSADIEITEKEAGELFAGALSRLLAGKIKTGPVLVLPPDITRFYSRAGYLTDVASGVLGQRLGAVMPALGTHMAMTHDEIKRMFPKTPPEKFLVHDWRNDVKELGRIDADWIEKNSEGKVRYDWPVQVNRILPDGNFSMIISIGQVVPHEVVGMANHTKNLFVGTGGKEAIDKSHFVGAAYGMEKMMGRSDTPVRRMFDEGFNRYGNKLPPVLYVLTVVGMRKPGEGGSSSSTAIRGIFIGFGKDCFDKAAALSREVNVDILDEPIKKAVVYLEPEEFRTTWLGNKAVYRTRMAMADNGELLILAPGLERFGEDQAVDKLIRKYGYCPSAVILDKVKKEKEIAENLSVAAHLIHGSSEGRFTIRYCPGPKLSRAEIESAGFRWGSLDEAMGRYDINKLALGWNTCADGERIFYVPNPALGLWAQRQRFYVTK
ncbi:MAG: lactate racemase domain-containing protein [Treponema sp.]|nr:lactate racemase domain-containing protein [Treponema sp.]